MAADKIILVHNGAVGDFLIAWPALLALARRYDQEAPLFYAGRETYMDWARAAGFEPAPAEMRAAVERLYSAADWRTPALSSLAGSLIVWIGLRTPPFAETLLDHRSDDPTRLVFLPMVGPDAEESTREHLARMLREQLGIAWPQDHAAVWRERVAGWSGVGRGGDVLLFPGAGHRAKEWPMNNWLDLARRLRNRGAFCRLALGPAELERGFDAQEIPVARPATLAELAAAIAGASVSVSADTGPLHLAALAGAPCIALFGPTSARQWAPDGVRILRAHAECRPCSRTTRSITCETRRCMATISVEEVERHVLASIAAQKEKPA
ncbi:hypothetical protein DPQ33_01975 [Oceanidesulfovibrio indonesiensis]|uniref:Glycosyltransferase family 9 protein n=1 Tax=Oceanidesulfovibrio indonesiensis TaxID=54767 RepID=A0A7M3MJM0_9BACT|nr:glycosyltransferase family 9 protein [Oceanidesulfovibrio indonesiensis]TVM20019.1 hypothetical protein DPQ33_01975 [Oceanidesulfovibrio indonesiensis]